MSGYGNYKTIGRLIQFRYSAHTIALCTHNIIPRKYIKLINARNVDVDDQGVQLPERYRIGNSGKAVLVAIAIPIFTSQLEKSRESTDAANIRSAYAEVVAASLADPETAASATVEKKQQRDGWQNAASIEQIAGVAIANINSTDETVVKYTPASGSTDSKVEIDNTEVDGSQLDSTSTGGNTNP